MFLLHRRFAFAVSTILLAGCVAPAEADTPSMSDATVPAPTVPVTIPLRSPMDGWSVDASLDSAAARLELARLENLEQLESELVAARLAEIEAEKQAAETRLRDLAATTTAARPRNAAQPNVAPNPGNQGVWDRLAQCESSGNWAINTGNGYSAGLQWAPGTWAAYRAASDPVHAWQASREQQIAAGERLLAASGGRFTAWPGCRAKLGLP